MCIGAHSCVCWCVLVGGGRCIHLGFCAGMGADKYSPIYASVCTGQRSTFPMIPQEPSTLFFETRFLTCLEAALG